MAQNTIWLLPIIGKKKTPPDPEGTRNALSRIGYSLEEAIGDIVDNSIDAKANNILIRFVREKEKVSRIVIADDGHGMSEAKLEKAMQFGAKMPHKSGDLGKYGIGLKSASFSQCEIFTVVTKENKKTSGMRWTKNSIKAGWLCEKIDSKAIDKLFDFEWGSLDLKKSGTLVIWENLDNIGRAPSINAENVINGAAQRISNHLGLIFHRFIENGLTISIDALYEDEGIPGIETYVIPLNPFSYVRSGAQGYPKKFTANLNSVGTLKMAAHVWPPKSKDNGYRLGGGKVAERQGFYFYRNDRLIQAGGWNGLREADAEPHLSLARVEIDLPQEYDSEFSLNVQKSRVEVPREFPEKVSESKSKDISFKDYIAGAQEAYRKRIVSDLDFPLIVGQGVPPLLKKEFENIFEDGSEKFRSVSVKWKNLKEDIFFVVDSDGETLFLNSLFREKLLNGKKASLNDLPLIKTLLFMLTQSDFDRKALSKKHQEWLAKLNRLIIVAINAEE